MATPSPMSEQTLTVYSATSTKRERKSTKAIPPTTASAAYADGQHRRDEAPETSRRTRSASGQREQLRAQEIALERVIEVVHVRQPARALDRERRRPERRADARVELQRLLQRAPERDEGDDGVGLRVDHVHGQLRRRVLVRHDARDALVVAQREERLGHRRLEILVPRVHRRRVEDGDDGRVDRVAEHLLDDRLRPLRLDPLDAPARQLPPAEEHGDREQQEEAAGP